MNKTLTAPALAAGMLALALTGCSADATTASNTDQPTASASATGTPAASETAQSWATEDLPGTLYENPVNPAGDGEAKFRIAWEKVNPKGGTDLIPATADNPSGADFSNMYTNSEQKHLPATDTFTQAEVEKYAAAGMAQYLAIRTDSRLFGVERKFVTDDAVVQDNRASFTDHVLNEWKLQDDPSEGYDYEMLWTMAYGRLADPEDPSKAVRIDHSSPHHLSIRTPTTFAFTGDGYDILSLKFRENLSLNAEDGRVITHPVDQEIWVGVKDGKAGIHFMEFKQKQDPESSE